MTMRWDQWPCVWLPMSPELLSFCLPSASFFTAGLKILSDPAVYKLEVQRMGLNTAPVLAVLKSQDVREKARNQQTGVMTPDADYYPKPAQLDNV